MKELFQRIAIENGTTEEQVYQEIQTAISAGMQSGDVIVQEKWKSMSLNCETPTPEEAICGIVAMLLADDRI